MRCVTHIAPLLLLLILSGHARRANANMALTVGDEVFDAVAIISVASFREMPRAGGRLWRIKLAGAPDVLAATNDNVKRDLEATNILIGFAERPLSFSAAYFAHPFVALVWHCADTVKARELRHCDQYPFIAWLQFDSVIPECVDARAEMCRWVGSTLWRGRTATTELVQVLVAEVERSSTSRGAWARWALLTLDGVPAAIRASPEAVRVLTDRVLGEHVGMERFDYLALLRRADPKNLIPIVTSGRNGIAIEAAESICTANYDVDHKLVAEKLQKLDLPDLSLLERRNKVLECLQKRVHQ